MSFADDIESLPLHFLTDVQGSQYKRRTTASTPKKTCFQEQKTKLSRVKDRQYPQGAQVIDFSFRGMGLAYTLLNDYDTLVLDDAIPHGGLPGKLYLKVLIFVAAIVILQQLPGVQRSLRTRSI